MVTFNPVATFANGKIFLNEYLDIFSLINGAQYFKVWAAPVSDWSSTPDSGAYLVVPNGGTSVTVFMDNDQIRQLSSALGHHVVTGQVSAVINGVSVVTSGDGVNITVDSIAYTTFLTNDQAQQLSHALAHYTVTQ